MQEIAEIDKNCRLIKGAGFPLERGSDLGSALGSRWRNHASVVYCFPTFMTTAPATMTGVVLPGNSTVEFKQFPVPKPGPGQVLVKMKASSICGSDIRAIYRAHLGKGPEGYQPGTIAATSRAGRS